MKTQDITAELEAVIQSLADQGKEPTVALVKARLKSTVPMPAIIATIKSWKASARVPKVEVGIKEASSDARIAALEEQVAELTKRLEALEKSAE
ncbi:hypothetical protein [Vibrio nigripulchritudo]|uniref:hypothetical protein n=1 Tax=Vibrio nigripulchritudo TaxID=28173 RepID=UPI00249034AB|nr:hypothetical protein [Vibrio nigripulchritudo]BDU36447.1 hypothetical protein TUMSATVNIG2_09160 [Vibrio nigripulchritudo]BDU42104.1 hypothetical protein TUMSATVNIG3_09020 [Vibrio nigripulchritudo]